MVEDEPSDTFDSRVAIDDEDGFAERLQRRDERIIMAKDHFVVQLAIDPAFDDALDVAEVTHHIAIVQRAGAHLDFRGRVMAVRVFADAVVVKQPVAVTEVDFFRN
jgi:hypothetical protein